MGSGRRYAARRLTPGGVWAWAWRRGGGAARGAGLGVSLAACAGRARSHSATDMARLNGRGGYVRFIFHRPGEDMIERVDEFEPSSDFHSVARQFATLTPAVQFSTIVWETKQWPGILVTTARRPFDERMALDVIQHVNRTWDGSLGGRPMLFLPGLRPARPAGMDVVVLLGPPLREQVGTIDPSLDPHTVVAFPAYHAEFTGRESPAEFDEIIHTTSNIGDWQRPLRKRRPPPKWIQETGPGYSS